MRELFLKLIEACKVMGSFADADHKLPDGELDDLSGVTTAEIMELYRDMYLVIHPAMTALDAVGAMIKVRVLEDCATAQFENVTARYIRPGMRMLWDGKGLAAYAETHPEIAEFEKPTPVSASVSIRVEAV